MTALRAFYYYVLLLSTVYSSYARNFFLGEFPNMELLLLSPLFFLLNSYIFSVGQYYTDIDRDFKMKHLIKIVCALWLP